MSNMVHIFTGTVEEVFLSTDPRNPFTSGFHRYHHGPEVYQIALVDSGEPWGRLLCYADFPLEPGDPVRGFYCRKLGDTTVGVLADGSLKCLLEKGLPMEVFTEYTAFRLSLDSSINRNTSPWYLQYTQPNGKRQNEVLQQELQRRGNAAFFAQGKVLSCSPKTEKTYCPATIQMDLDMVNGYHFSAQIRRYLDLPVSAKKTLTMLVYPGQEANPAVHVLPLLPYFCGWFKQLTANELDLILQFIGSRSFRMLGRILTLTAYVPENEDRRYRVLISGKHSQTDTHYLRPISLNNPLKQWRNIDSACKCAAYAVGTIREADIDTEESGQFRFTVLMAEETAPPQPKAEEEPPKEIAAASDGLLTVREGELSLWRSTSSDAASNHTNKNRPFNSAWFQKAVLNRQLDVLHYDVLHWIGFLRYTTGNHIFRLFLSGMLPVDPLALSQTQQNAAANICAKIALKNTYLPEGDTLYPVQYPVRDNDALKKIIHKLQENGLVEAADFITVDGGTAMAKVLIITQQGVSLLQALRRRNSRFDNFAYLRSARFVKTILSANQLAIAYLQALNPHYPTPMENLKINPCIILRPEGEEKDAVVRPGFTLLTRKNPDTKGLLLVGESVRNTVGLSKQLDDQNIREKLPRMIRIVRRSAQVNDQHTALTFVFASYDEMMFYADFIRETLGTLEPEEKFHVYLTYDMLLMGQLDGTHFHFHPETGAVERVRDLTKQLLSYLDEA